MSSGSRPVAGSCGHDDESSGDIKAKDFMEYLGNYYLIIKDYAPYSVTSLHSPCTW